MIGKIGKIGKTLKVAISINVKPIKTRWGSPVDCRPSTAEAPPTGKIHQLLNQLCDFDTLGDSES